MSGTPEPLLLDRRHRSRSYFWTFFLGLKKWKKNFYVLANRDSSKLFWEGDCYMRIWCEGQEQDLERGDGVKPLLWLFLVCLCHCGYVTWSSMPQFPPLYNGDNQWDLLRLNKLIQGKYFIKKAISKYYLLLYHTPCLKYLLFAIV